MKRFIRILVLAVALFTGLTTVTAQTVQVQMIPKVPVLPSTVTSYLDDPLRYFNVHFFVTGAGSEGLEIFFDMDLSVNTSPLYIRTQPDVLPLVPIRVYEGDNRMKSDELSTQVMNRTENNIDFNSLINAQQLPEGNYTLCVEVYLWSDRLNPARESIRIGSCPNFDICYSGSAPELVSPMAGAQPALNGAMVVAPNRKLDFLWTPVISNCAGRNTRFKYKLKVVKVLAGQNYLDAIKYNPTVFSAEVRNDNFAVFDTLRDIKVQMEKGALYVAQVQAEQLQTRGNDFFIVANDGNSQPMPFFWGYDGSSEYGLIEDPSRSARYNTFIDDESEEGEESEGVDGLTKWEGGVEEVSELGTIAEEMKEQYLAGFILDDATVAGLTATYPEERKYVPTPQRRYVASDGYYTVPMTDDLEVSFMPARHGSLKKTSYAIELYYYVDGGVDSITAYEPLFREEIDEVPDEYNKMDSHELISRTLKGWGSELEQGYLYYLQLTGNYTLDYWNYSIADTSFYVNEMFAEHTRDTVSREFVEDELLAYSNGVFFQWGDDPEAPAYTTPQWKAPVDRSDDDIYDPVNYVVPASVTELKKAKTFPVSWTPVKDVAEGDEVQYEVNVYELKPGQTLEEAVATNEALVTRTVTNANEISETDTDFFKVFSPKKTYLLTLSTIVLSESNAYHFENGNGALPVVFKIVK